MSVDLSARDGSALTIFTTESSRVIVLTAPPSGDEGDDLTVEFVALDGDKIWHRVPNNPAKDMEVVDDALSDALNVAFAALYKVESIYLEVE